MATVARSFLHSNNKIEDDMIFETYKECVEMLIDVIGHKDGDVNRYALEGIRTILKSNNMVV